MGNIDTFCSSMHHWCEDMDMHYGQGNGDFPLPRYDFSYGGSADCTSMLAHCLQEGGFDVPSSVWSGNIADCLENIGWTRYAGDGLPARGAVLVNYANHAAMWDGSQVVEFGGDPHQGYCTTHGFYDYPWDCYMLPPENGGDAPQPHGGFSRADGQTGSGVVYEVHTAAGWLGAVSRADDGGDGYAGDGEQAIDGVRAYRADGQELRIQALMDDGSAWSDTTFRGSMDGSNTEGDGYAGDIGSGRHIIGLRCFGCEVRVACANEGWFSWTSGDASTGEGDDFAGDDLAKRKPIVAVQMRA